MKKLMTFFLFSFIIAVSLFSQAIQYEIRIKYTRTAADIIIHVKEGQTPLTYYLMTNDPMNGKVLMKSEPTRNKNYVFKDVEPGKYFIKIEDSKGLPAGKTVEIKENEN
jgi:hypothetical protein